LNALTGIGDPAAPGDEAGKEPHGSGPQTIGGLAGESSRLTICEGDLPDVICFRGETIRASGMRQNEVLEGKGLCGVAVHISILPMKRLTMFIIY
jgi:hypothetical protein